MKISIAILDIERKKEHLQGCLDSIKNQKLRGLCNIDVVLLEADDEIKAYAKIINECDGDYVFQLESDDQFVDENSLWTIVSMIYKYHQTPDIVVFNTKKIGICAGKDYAKDLQHLRYVAPPSQFMYKKNKHIRSKSLLKYSWCPELQLQYDILKKKDSSVLFIPEQLIIRHKVKNKGMSDYTVVHKDFQTFRKINNIQSIRTAMISYWNFIKYVPIRIRTKHPLAYFCGLIIAYAVFIIFLSIF